MLSGRGTRTLGHRFFLPAVARRRGYWAAGLLLAVALGCSKPPAPLVVSYAGCAEVSHGPVCRLDEARQLRLWVEAAPGSELRIEGAVPESPQPRQVDGGLLYSVTVATGASSLEISSGAPRARWQLRLEEPRQPPEIADRVRTRCLTEHDCEGACELLQEWLDEHPDSPDAGYLLGMLGRIRRYIEQTEEAAEKLAASAASHERMGYLLSQVDDSTVLVHLLIEQRDFQTARAVLAALPAPGPDTDALPAEARYYLAYYRGLLAEIVGDPRSALRHLSSAAQLARRAGMAREQQLTEQLLARQLQGLGRSEEAAALFARLRQESSAELNRCDQAQLLNNHAWALILAMEAGHRVDDPTPLLEQSLAIISETGCPRSNAERANISLNLALAHLHQGRLQEARADLRTARELSTTPPVQQRLWWLDIAGRLALAAGQGEEAVERYRELERLADATLSLEAQWRAAVGRGRALHILGRRQEALAAFARVEDLLDEESLQVPLQEGRETFVASRGLATRLYLDLLLEADETEQAMLAARRSRARILSGLRHDERLAHLGEQEQAAWDGAVARYRARRDELEADLSSDWELPSDQLATLEQELGEHQRALAAILDEAYAILQGSGPSLDWRPAPDRAGELTLLYYPLPHGWVGFARDETGTRACRLGPIEPVLGDPEALAALILQPFHAEIDRAERLRVLSFGPLRQVDIHALPYGDDILLKHKVVVYGLDLPSQGSSPAAGIRTVLVVADPTNDLPGSRQEAAAVVSALGDSELPAAVRVLRGNAATGEAVRELLPRVDLFHYSGHARFDSNLGWGSALPLSSGGELAIGDILTLEKSPALVVLSGCETARTTSQAPIESIALSHAFVLRGASQVVATSRPVRDRTAIEVAAELYRAPVGEWDAAILLRRAQLAARQRQPDMDWASYRVIEP